MGNIIKIDGFDKAIIGTTCDNKLIYEYDAMVAILCEKQNLTKEEAEDFIEYNTIRELQYIENTPIIANTKFLPLLFEIENSMGDTTMRCEVDLKNGKIKTQNCTVADVENNYEEIFESNCKIRLQQNDEYFNFSGIPNIFEIPMEDCEV